MLPDKQKALDTTLPLFFMCSNMFTEAYCIQVYGKLEYTDMRLSTRFFTSLFVEY